MLDVINIQVEEECGFVVPVNAVRPVTMYVSAVGISGSRHHMFCVEVDESMRINGGGGVQYVLFNVSLYTKIATHCTAL